jgi:predicted TIM-barrel fold metal-dependent hydrolase
MPAKLEEWLKLTKEAPLEPDLPICDPHHHLWDYPDTMPEERVSPSARPMRHYLMNDLINDIPGGHNIVKTVFIQCSSMYRKDGPPEMRPVGEVEFVQGIAAQAASGQYGHTEIAAGIVGFADLMLGAGAAPVLEAHIATARSRFKGIRYMATWDATIPSSFPVPPHLLLDAKFREGFECLRRYGLSFDAWMYHTQLSDLVSLARAFPDVPIILNHIGGPLGTGPYAGKQDEVFALWKKGIADLATCPNVTVKLGGLGMPRIGFGWSERPTPPGSIELAKQIEPHFYFCIEKFGVGRCMFESNFPVDKVSYSYTVIWNAFKRMTKGFSPRERASLFHDTAVKEYRLG